MCRPAMQYRLLALGIGILIAASFESTSRSVGREHNSLRLSGKFPSSQVQQLKPESARLKQKYAQLPLAFEPNQGQTDSRVRYLARGAGYTVFLTSDEAVLSITAREAPKGHHAIATTALDLRFVGADASLRVSGQDQLAGKSNYFEGSHPGQWRTNVPHYGKVGFEDVYPGIGLVFYGNGRQLEQDWVVAPGADPERITFEVDGADRLSLDEKGNLRVSLSNGELSLRRPVMYQVRSGGDGARVPVQGGFSLAKHHQVRFRVGAYDHAKPLIIDPVLVYSSYLGGSAVDEASAVAIDSAGDAYVTGDTNSLNFPVTSGVFQTSCKLDTLGVCERSAFVTEINPGGSAEIFSTYLGGSGSQLALGIALDAAGDAFVTGQTTSTDFPTQNAYQGSCSLDANNVCYDAYVAVVKAGGSALLYSSYLGGSGIDSGNHITVDSSGNAYVTGQTASINFPTTKGVVQTTCGTDGQCNASSGTAQPDAFVAKINTKASGASSLVYSTYLGGSGADYGTGIAIDSSLNAYITGSSNSTDLPVTSGVFQSACKLDASSVCEGGPFVAKLNPTATALTYLTYLSGSGGGGLDTAHDLALDSAGNAYIVGQTGSPDFPVTAGAFQTSCGSDGQCNPVNGVATQHAFISKLNAAGTKLVYSSFLSGSGYDFATAVSVDTANVPYVTGGTYSSDFPVSNALPTGGASGGGEDAFVTALNSQGTGLILSTYLGGTGNDVGNGIVRDGGDDVYVVGSTTSTDFPTLNPFQKANNGATDAFITQMGSTTAAVVTLTPSTLTFASQEVASTSAGQALTLSNIGNAALSISQIATTGDFAETNNCGASLAAGASCTVTVTFTPTAIGARSGTVTVTDDASTSPQTASLTGTGIAPVVSLTPPSLSFASQIVNTTSSPQTVTLMNVGTATLNISSIKLTGANSNQFVLSSACGATLAVGKSCTMTVTFKPTEGGTLLASIGISDNASGSPQNVAITGLGADFIISSWPGTSMGGATVSAGKEAIYNIKIMPLGGFDQPVTVTCSGNPQNSTCVVWPSTATPPLGRDPIDVSLDVFTTAGSSAPPEPLSRRVPPLGPEGRRLVGLAVLGLGLVVLRFRKRRAALILALALLSAMVWVSCGNSNPLTVTTTAKAAGTPAGTYTLTVTGTSGNITHTITTPLTVQ